MDGTRTYPYEVIGLGGEFIPYVYCRRGTGHIVCSMDLKCGGKEKADEYAVKIARSLNRLDALTTGGEPTLPASMRELAREGYTILFCACDDQGAYQFTLEKDGDQRIVLMDAVLADAVIDHSRREPMEREFLRHVRAIRYEADQQRQRPAEMAGQNPTSSE